MSHYKITTIEELSYEWQCTGKELRTWLSDNSHSKRLIIITKTGYIWSKQRGAWMYKSNFWGLDNETFDDMRDLTNSISKTMFKMIVLDALVGKN